MTMRPATRTQAKPETQKLRELTAIDCTNDHGVTRQELKDEADINIILSRFGIDRIQQRQNYPFEIDFTVDLQQTLNSVNDSRNAFNRLQPQIQNEFGNWQNLVNAMADGTLSKRLEKIGVVRNPEITMVEEIDAELARAEKRQERIREKEAQALAQAHRERKSVDKTQDPNDTPYNRSPKKE